MATNNLSSSSLLIESMVNNLGTVTMGQIHAMFPKINAETIQFYIMALVKKQRIRLIDGIYLVPYVKKTADIYMAKSVWIMIDNLKGKHIKDEEYQLSFAGETPVKTCFMLKNTLYEIIPLDKYTINNINYVAEKDRFRTVKNESEDLVKYIFVIEDEEMLDRLSAYEINVPYVIALTDYRVPDEMPIIQYFGEN